MPSEFLSPSWGTLSISATQAIPTLDPAQQQRAPQSVSKGAVVMGIGMLTGTGTRAVAYGATNGARETSQERREGRTPMRDIADVSGLASSNDIIAPVRILDAQGEVVRVFSADEFRRTHPRVAAGRDFRTAVRRPRRGKMKGLVASVATLVVVMITSPAVAYMAVITTSV